MMATSSRASQRTWVVIHCGVVMNPWWHVLPVVALMAWASSALAANDVCTASLEVTADQVQPANAPILLTLTVRNTGKTPIRYWWSGPSDDPDARDFTATVIDRKSGTSSRMALSNGQTPEAAGRSREILPGRFVRLPAAMPPMPPGDYTVNVVRDADEIDWPSMKVGVAVTVQVIADQDLLAARDHHIIASVRANDPFAQYVAASWSRKPVKDALIEDLKGANVVAADRAADGLWFGAEPSQDDGAIVAGAILHHLNAPTDGCDLGLMDKLLKSGDQSPSDEVRMAASRLIAARHEGHVGFAATAILNLPTKEVKDIWIPRQPPVPNGGRGTDPVQIARHDAMLEMLESHDPSDREFACSALADFPESQTAVDALRKAGHDVDVDVRMAAVAALDRVGQYRGLYHQLPFPATQP